jgi:hypothetical protein
MAEAVAIPTVMVVRQWVVSGIAGAGTKMLFLRGSVITALGHGGGVSEGVLDDPWKGGEGG